MAYHGGPPLRGIPTAPSPLRWRVGTDEMRSKASPTSVILSGGRLPTQGTARREGSPRLAWQVREILRFARKLAAQDDNVVAQDDNTAAQDQSAGTAGFRATTHRNGT